MVVLEKCVYVIGGCDSRDIHVGVLVASNACFQYHLTTNTWKKLNYMNHCRLFHGATALNGLIYAVGGRNDNGKVLSSVETFDPKTNNWVELDPPLCCPRMTMGVVAHKGLLFVAGGMIQLSSKLYQTADVEVYNPEMNRWHFKISKLPSPCCFVTLVDTGTKLFAIGGASHSNSLQSSCDVCVYDNEAKTWKKTVSLPSPRHSVAAASVGEKVYVFGGLTTVRMRALNEILVLEPTCSKWKKAGSLPTPMVGLATVTIPQDEETLAKSQQLDSDEITKFIL
ncbi:beta-scruin-like [Tachypleus tridentatus]|uniref:beta-scruin-like n=1 Tax=Tachypleus tridentatus TaxID=6853 RepID=UPI003FD6AFF7